MKKLIYVMIVFGLTLSQADICWHIQDKDQQYYCESVYEGKSNCWRIKNDSRRYLCESVKGKKSCWRIKDEEKRIMCKAQTGQ